MRGGPREQGSSQAEYSVVGVGRNSVQNPVALAHEGLPPASQIPGLAQKMLDEYSSPSPG